MDDKCNTCKAYIYFCCYLCSIDYLLIQVMHTCICVIICGVWKIQLHTGNAHSNMCSLDSVFILMINMVICVITCIAWITQVITSDEKCYMCYHLCSIDKTAHARNAYRYLCYHLCSTDDAGNIGNE